jgi:hypothetical protein
MSFCAFRTLNWSYFNSDDGLPKWDKRPDLLLCYPCKKVGICIELKYEGPDEQKPIDKTAEYALDQVGFFKICEIIQVVGRVNATFLINHISLEN